MSITLSVYYCFNNFWRRKIISCVIRSPADYMAEWENAPLDPKKKKKQRVNLEPRRPMAARLKKKQRVNLEPPRPMAARLIKCVSRKKSRGHLPFKSINCDWTVVEFQSHAVARHVARHVTRHVPRHVARHDGAGLESTSGRDVEVKDLRFENGAKVDFVLIIFYSARVNYVFFCSFLTCVELPELPG